LHLVGSIGLKIFANGEWLDQKHGIRSRRRRRKLWLGVDAGTHEIVAVAERDGHHSTAGDIGCK
jgi:hypothetical protein